MPTTRELSTMVEAQKSQLDEIKVQMTGIANAVAGLTQHLTPSTDAKHNPVTAPPKPVVEDATREELGVHGYAELEVEEPVIHQPKTGDVDATVFGEMAKRQIEEFMRDELTVEIQQTSEEQADQVFEISVNGDSRLFRRGQVYTDVKRYHVEGMARSKPVHYSNEMHTRQDGVREYRWPRSSGLRYNFSVLHDPSPMGRAWLQAVLRQP